jgi:hypothetical protein
VVKGEHTLEISRLCINKCFERVEIRNAFN